MKKLISCLLGFIIINLLCCVQKDKFFKWICYYGAVVDNKNTEEYDLVILEPENYTNAAFLTNKYKLAYLSVGECNITREYWQEIKDKKFIGKKNLNWDSYKIDIRSKEWQDLLLNKLIPQFIKMGYNGLFLDTFEEAYWDEIDKEPDSAGKINALTTLLENIKKKYPDIFILTNRGLRIMDKIAKNIDGVLWESLVTNYNFQKKKYEFQQEKDLNAVLKELNYFCKNYNKPVFIIEYASSSDYDIIKKSKEICKKNGLNLYIAEIGLDKIY